MAKQSSKDIRATREHEILKERRPQLSMNLSVLHGGKPYIKERLSKFPSESDLSWKGKGETKGRPDRAFLVNYAARIIQKLVQYTFAQGVVREGIDPDFEKDATKTGTSVNQFWKQVHKDFLGGQWGWVQIDRGSPGVDQATGKPNIRSIADRKAADDRVFFAAWRSTEVVDWAFDSSGGLLWLITEEVVYENSDPMVEAKLQKVRTLWEQGKGTRMFLKEGGEAIERSEDFTLSASVVPFVPIGSPDASPYWFDDVEMIQASILNLDSAHHENLIKAVFPQLVLPAGIIQEVMSMSERTFDEALELIRGIEYPLLEPNEASGLTRLIVPGANDLKAIPDEILRRRKEMMEIVGQALRQDTKQVASAESKAWDHKDIEAALADNAETLEDAEMKAVAIAKELDSSFDEYVPVYPRQFDLPDLGDDWKILQEMEASGNLPDAMIREIAKTKIKILGKIVQLDPEVVAQAFQEIDDMELDDLDAIAQGLPPQIQDDGEDGSDDEVSDLPAEKIPLALQQIALARERAIKANDAALAAALGAKIDELTDRL